MAEDRHPVEDASTRLVNAKDRQLGFKWPLPLDARLDDLVDRANTAGERTNRRELLAAILLSTDHDGDSLGELLRTYRTATVGDAVLDRPGAQAQVLEFPAHRPGPRTR